MCLVLFALQTHEEYPFVVLANRDEFFDRPTLAASLWLSSPEIAAGQDLLAGGTWLGLTRQGQFATITNYSENPATVPPALSRGRLALKSLLSPIQMPAKATLRAGQLDQYSGFNLVHGDIDRLWWQSNRPLQSTQVAAGFSGLSNHLLNTPWHKVTLGKSLLRDALARNFNSEDLFSILANTDSPQPIVDQGLGAETQRKASSSTIFVENDLYGTRSSTVILVNKTNQVRFIERTFSVRAQIIGETCLDFTLDRASTLPEMTTTE